MIARPFRTMWVSFTSSGSFLEKLSLEEPQSSIRGKIGIEVGALTGKPAGEERESAVRMAMTIKR